MTTKAFVAKVSQVRNSKKKDYYIHRINIPTNIVDELNLGKEDYLLLKAEKAEWYHLLDWSQMDKTWNRLPEDIKMKIKKDGLFDGTRLKESIPSENEMITAGISKIQESKNNLSAG